MIIFEFFKEYNTTWEELQKKALLAVDEFQKNALNLDNGELAADLQYEDYRQVLKLGLKTFIMQVLNDWKAAEEPILIFNNKFYQRFDSIQFDGFIRNVPFKFESSDKIFKILKAEKIPIEVEDFEKISSIFEEYNTIATVEVLDYKLYELDEIIDTKYSSDSFKDDEEDDLEDI